jgi:hypothetical protein
VTGTFLVEWLGFPAAMLAICAGLGLLVARISGHLDALLVLPVGLATAYTVGVMTTAGPTLAPGGGWVIAGLAAIGLLLALRSGIPRPARSQLRAAAWPALAALGVFLIVGGPVISGGQPSYTGYLHIVDIGHQFDLGAHVADAGRQALPPVVPGGALPSGANEVVSGFLAAGYPVGGQSLVALLGNLIGTDQIWLWQPFIAFVAAMGALAAYRLAGQLIGPRPLRGVAALIAPQANILYGYTIDGGIKEISSAIFLLLSAAILVDGRATVARWRRPVPLALALSAALASISLTIVPWIGMLLAVTGIGTVFGELTQCGRVVLARWRHRAAERWPVPPWRVLFGWGELCALTALLSFPAISVASKAAAVASSSNVLPGNGNLVGPMPVSATNGVWITGDYRFPLALGHAQVTHAAAVLVLVLAVVGTIAAILRRRWPLVALAAAGAAALLYIFGKYDSGWLRFKAECVTAPISLLLAFSGAGALLSWRRARPAVGWIAPVVASLLIAGAVLWGNALEYHDTTLAPYEPLHELEDIGNRYAGNGPTFYPAFDEVAEYLLRKMTAFSTEDPPLNHPIDFVGGYPTQFFQLDLNTISATYLALLKYIVQRRSPGYSRPPGDFTLVDRTRYFDVFERTGSPTRIFAHLPLAGAPRTAAVCRSAQAQLRAAGPGASIDYVVDPDAVQIIAPLMAHSTDFNVLGGGAFAPTGPGWAESEFTLPRAGRWQVWLGGSIERPVRIDVDGRHVGTVGWIPSYPFQYAQAATLTLSAGPHKLYLSRGGGSLRGGNGDGFDESNRTIGPIEFSQGAMAEQPITSAPGSALPRLCADGQPWSWLEILRG